MHPTSSNDPTIVGVDIFGASTHDATRLIAFYREVLGMVPTAIGDGQAPSSRCPTVMDPLETPVCYIAFGRDPDGNRFGLHERKVS
jgi:predicted enzyme related to lactoylglutathione lyase